jgi:manganese-dependent inorganic pyrophosphatase
LETILISGHKNPDIDSMCSAYAYAELKRKIDPARNYVPILPGALSVLGREVFRVAGVEPPRLVATMHQTISEIMRLPEFTLSTNDSILEAIKLIKDENISMIPVLDNNGAYTGSVSVNEISSYVLSQLGPERPVYAFSVDNFHKVIPGKLLRQGELLEFSAQIMTGAMPNRVFEERLKKLTQKPVLVVGNRPKILEVAVQEQIPAIVVTGLAKDEPLDVDYSAYKGSIFLSETDTAESIRLLRLSTYVERIMDKTVPRLDSKLSVDEGKKKLIQSHYRGFPVFDNGRFAGIVTRRCFIDLPKKKLILVDHNEVEQSVEGAIDAEIVEIIDHHRLAASKTQKPITLYARPVGSTCTLIYQQYQYFKQEIPKHVALLLLSGIIADTVFLRSPTTTADDHIALGEVSKIAGVDPQKHADFMFAQIEAIRHRDPSEVVLSDFKVYEQNNVKIGIGQVELVTLEDIPAMLESFRTALSNIATERKLAWAMLLLTDVMRQESILITNGNSVFESHFVYEQKGNSCYFLPGVLSRKKQLLPELFRVLECAN